MSDPLWRLLMTEPSELSCEECFAVLEFYAGLLTEGGPGLLPQVLERLQGCPACPTEYGLALKDLERIFLDDNRNLE